jgi:serine/threonine protein kinase/Tol biopolymer transport system component
MSLAEGARFGRYEITGRLGAGGMGEVYRARDTRLSRDVAIKVLPDLAVGDHDRRVRFEREAQLLASLNHPNIAQIYGLEDVQGGHLALAMELVDGETLSTLIARQGRSAPAAVASSESTSRGATPSAGGAPRGINIEDALAIARQIAAGLEAAHGKGIIHRDLKPGNVMVAADGQVKILDFGLGKALEPDSSHDASNSPTITLGATQAGMILGTAAYMSPEQAKGRAADKRSDIWAFGCVLYELLTGQRAFAGDDVSETLASVLKDRADLSKLPAATPRTVRVLVEKCLTRDRSARLGDISTATFLLSETGAFDPAQPVAPPATRSMKRGAAVALVLTSVVITAAIAYWSGTRRAQPATGAVTHVSVGLPPGDELSDEIAGSFAISPDGRRVVYIAATGGVTKLFDRSLDSVTAKAIPGTEGGSGPFFSPNGRSVGFFAQNRLKKVSIDGGTVETLVTGVTSRGGTWGEDGFIYFTTTNVSPISRVPESGGPATVVTKLRPDQGEISHRWPQVLPGGKGLVFSIWTGPGTDEKLIAVQPLPAGEHQVVVKGGTTGRYVPPGYLLYTRADDLFVVPMNAATMSVDNAAPVKLPERVLGEAREGSAIAVSRSVLAYLVADAARLDRRLVWMDDNGLATELPLPHKVYEHVAISPDKRTAVVQIVSGSIELWLLDLERNTLTPFVTTGGSSQAPVWTPDGKRVIYRATRNGSRNLYWKPVDGGDEERLTTKPGFVQTPASAWAGAGSTVLTFSETGARQAGRLWTLTLEGTREAKPLVAMDGTENAHISPDGKWMAFQIDSSGTTEVYLQPFAGGGARVQVSSGGGAESLWSKDGKTLYFLAGTTLMAVEVSTSPSLVVGKPRTIATREFVTSPNSVTAYAIGKDGRFLRVQSVGADPAARSIQLVLNWDEELRRLVR